jgi:WD40 repeat protein
VAVTPDGKQAVSASADNTLRIWDLNTGDVLHTLQGHSEAVDSVAITPDGLRAISASRDDTLKLWNLDTGQTIATFHCDGYARCCAFAGDRIIAGDTGGRLYLLSLVESEGESGQDETAKAKA